LTLLIVNCLVILLWCDFLCFGATFITYKWWQQHCTYEILKNSCV